MTESKLAWIKEMRQVIDRCRGTLPIAREVIKEYDGAFRVLAEGGVMPVQVKPLLKQARETSQTYGQQTR